MFAFFTFAPMKRQLLVTLVLLLCALRSFSGTEQKRAVLLPGAAAIDLLPSPLSACRYKKPFPFQCVQLIKKRLTNPPDLAQVNVCSGHIQAPASSDDAFFCMNNRLAPVQPGESKRVSLLFPAAHWHACNIGRNVFHPPPAAT
jgi:hypothetical protein